MESAEDGRRRLAALRIRQRLRVAVESAEDRTLAVVPLAHKRALALLPHNTTCLRSPHNAMHSPSIFSDTEMDRHKQTALKLTG